jgi:hypothetical protein
LCFFYVKNKKQNKKQPVNTGHALSLQKQNATYEKTRNGSFWRKCSASQRTKRNVPRANAKRDGHVFVAQ